MNNTQKQDSFILKKAVKSPYKDWRKVMTVPALRAHQKGEQSTSIEAANNRPENTILSVDTFGGRVHIEWDPQSAVTPLGQLPFFIEFLKLRDLFFPWVEECPLHSLSPKAPSKKDVLGTL